MEKLDCIALVRCAARRQDREQPSTQLDCHIKPTRRTFVHAYLSAVHRGQERRVVPCMGGGASAPTSMLIGTLPSLPPAAQLLRALLGAWTLTALAWHFPELHRFYDKSASALRSVHICRPRCCLTRTRGSARWHRSWPRAAVGRRWSCSGISIAERRGLGSGPSKLYGVLPVPALSPAQLRAAGAALAAGLAVGCTAAYGRSGFALAFVMYHAYFPQLFASRIVGGHVTILLPAAFGLAACCPSGAVWGLALLRVYVASAYCSSGVAKVWNSWRIGTYWCVA
jgi:hypothetical protein